CFDWSGKSSTLSPLASLYSVIPSTEVTRSMPLGSGPGACDGQGRGRVALAGVTVSARALVITNKKAIWRLMTFIFLDLLPWNGLRRCEPPSELDPAFSLAQYYRAVAEALSRYIPSVISRATLLPDSRAPCIQAQTAEVCSPAKKILPSGLLAGGYISII